MLECHGLSHRFGAFKAVDQVNFKVNQGERRVILGPNGAGKTTFLRLLGGELTAKEGKIRFLKRDVTRLDPAERTRLGLSRSFQKNFLFEELTIFENLALAAASPLPAALDFIKDSFQDKHVRLKIDEIAALTDLEKDLHFPVHSAPYGTKRKVEIALALACDPKLVLMDEPTSGVDLEFTGAFHQLLKNLPETLTLIIIEHDVDLAFDLADRISVMHQGTIAFEGTPDEVRNSDFVQEIYLGQY